MLFFEVKHLVLLLHPTVILFLVLVTAARLHTVAAATATFSSSSHDSDDQLSSHVKAAEVWLVDHADKHLQRLIQFLRIPSVSGVTSRRAAMHDAATWVEHELRDAGLQNVHQLPTPLHPCVYGEWKTNDASAPTVLLYGHYDVIPEDPVSEWTKTRDPFEAVVIDDRIYARGASDNKGPLYSVIAAIRAWLLLSTNSTTAHYPQQQQFFPALNLKLLVDGEEEIGSPNLASVIEHNKELLQADFAFSVDGGMIDEHTPSLPLSLRGAIAFDINIRSAAADMHSGTFGGGVMNPAFAMAYLLSKLRDEKSGRVLVDGFYDDVIPISDDIRQEIAESRKRSGDNDLLASLGVNESVGEQGYDFLERYVSKRLSDVVVGITSTII